MVANATAIKYLDETHRVLNFLDRSIEPEVGDRGWGALSCKIKGIDTKRHAINAVLSSDDEDRYGEVVDPKGFGPFLERFNENPQLLYCHDHTVNLGEWEKMKITTHTFEGWAVFDDGDEHAMKIFRKYERKFMRAFSVGFIAHEWEMEQTGKGNNKRMRRRFTLQEPIEGTACTVPANPAALSKAFGMTPPESPEAPEIKSTATPAIDYAKLAQAMREGGLDEMLQGLITNQIAKTLTDPVGPVDSLMREVVAAVQADGSCGHHHDPASQAPGTSAKGTHLSDEAKTQLREMLAD